MIRLESFSPRIMEISCGFEKDDLKPRSGAFSSFCSPSESSGGAMSNLKASETARAMRS